MPVKANSGDPVQPDATFGSGYPATLLGRMSLVPRTPGRRVLTTARGSQSGAFGPVEWSLLTGVALVWGSSYLLIEIGLESLAPAVITWARVTLGFVVLIWFPAARRPMDRADWRQTTILALVWTSFPFLLSPISQQHIDSALAGMINSLIPIFAASIAMVFLREVPAIRQIGGLLLGLVGAASLALPAASQSSAAAWGVLLAVVAAVLYGLGLTLTIPLQQRYGGPAVMLRVLGVSAVATAPFGIAGLWNSSWETTPVAAVTVLGFLNTGIGFLLMVGFAGRVGPTRAGVAIYFLPIVAIALGIVFRSEVVLPIQWAGTGLVLLGAFLVSRREH
ncbi:MAG: DMT family transporter [bacterium]|nr:DMT family transporter [bacterium]